MDNNRNSQTNRISLGQRINATIQKLNTTSKLFLLFLYTAILIVSTALVTRAVSRNRYFSVYKDYAEVTEDENVFVSVRLSERRSMLTEKESSYYDFYVTVFEKDNRDIQQVKLEHVVITKGGKSIFGDTSVKTPSSRSTSFALSPSPRKAVAENIDETPDTLYLKVMYKVEIEGQTTKQDKELFIKEKIEYEKQDDKRYELVTPDSTGKNDNPMFSFTIQKTSSNISITPRAKEIDKIKTVRLSTLIKVAKEPTDTDNLISEDFLAYSCYGSFNSAFNLPSYNFNLDAKYNPATVYVKAEIEKYGQEEIEEVFFKFEYSNIPLQHS
jgi:hypothetical protein